MTKSKGQRELEAAGFTVIRAVGTVPVLGRGWSGEPTLRGAREVGKWFEVKTPDGKDEVLILRQSPGTWHAFWTFEGTTSGSSPLESLRGSLGDVIGTDGQLRSYMKIVSKAPHSLAQKYHGLSAAKSQVYNERHG